MFNHWGPTLGATPSHLGSMFFKKDIFDLFVATERWSSERLEDPQVLAESFTPLHWFTLSPDLQHVTFLSDGLS